MKINIAQRLSRRPRGKSADSTPLVDSSQATVYSGISSIRPLWGKDYELLQVQVDDLYMAQDGRAYISERLGAGVWILEADF